MSYQRIALFIFFDAIEKDLVTHIRSISNRVDGNILTKPERDKAILRSKKKQEFPAVEINDFDILNYLDFGEKIDIVQRYKQNFDESLRKHLSLKSPYLQKSISTRNSVMHGRPLTVEEQSVSFALASDLVKSKNFWPNLNNQFKKYNENPESITRDSISYLESDVDQYEIFHNLPTPDYEDTGFVPRPKLEKELRKRITGRNPTVTVLGDGGNGKTALTLQTLYGLINSGEHNFEAIVWVSAKSSKLTVGEIQRVENAIISSLGMFDAIADVFGDKGKDSFSRVQTLLENNKILLVIDNLETVLDDTIRKFALDVPGCSKILFTSRVPIGGDQTVSVGPLSEIEGEVYFRALIKSFNISYFDKKNTAELRKYANKLGNKPLLLKWFCFCVMAGQSPAKILANPEMALRFCLENVFDALGSDAKMTLSILSILPRASSLGVLQYVSDVKVQKLETGLAELLKFTILDIENIDDLEVNYKIKPFARAYVNRILKIENEDRDKIISKFRKLKSVFEIEKSARGRSRYDTRYFTVRSTSEALAVQKLKCALRLSAKEDFQGALDVLALVKISHPDYFEVYRADAFVKIRHNDITGANVSYETAVDLAPEVSQIHYFYGGFFLRSYNDCKSAIKHLGVAHDLDPESIEIKRELARVKMFDFDFVGADEILAEGLNQDFANLRSKLIFSDLRVQNFQRMIENFTITGINADLDQPMEDFTIFLKTIDPAIVDETMLQHLKKALNIIKCISTKSDNKNILLDEILNLINTSSSKFISDNSDTSNTLINNVIGSLKEHGRKPTFGFLVDTSGREAFFPKSSVSDLIWEDLCSGDTAKYDIKTDDEGRPTAVNIKIYSGV